MLVCQQTDLIKPDLIRLLFVVALHLESDVDLFLVPVRLRSVVRIHRISLIGHTDAEVVNLIADAFKFPHKVDPGVGGKVIAGHRGGHPDDVQGIPNIPLMSLGEITLRSPSPARAAEGLVYIECQRLRSVAVVDINQRS